LSRAYAIEGDSDRSAAMLDRIAADYPGSKYIDEVQFRRGESLFVVRDYRAAETAYGQVVANHPESLFYDKALYKYGWAQFKQSRYPEALDSFIRLLDFNLEQGKLGEISLNPELSRADRELLDDVVRVVSLTFSYQDDKHFIASYFSSNGKRDFEPLLYLGLGQFYLDKARIVELLWKIAYADGRLDKYEDSLVLRISDLLYVNRAVVMRLKHEAGQTAV